jgi:predicted small secreted protein
MRSQHLVKALVLAAAISVAACGTMGRHGHQCGPGADAAARSEEAARRAEIAAAAAQEAAQRADAAAIRLEREATAD